MVSQHTKDQERQALVDEEGPTDMPTDATAQ